MSSTAISRLIDSEIARQIGALRPRVSATVRASESIIARAQHVLTEHAQLDVDQAIKDGRIDESERAAWIANLRDAPRVARRVLAAQPAGRFIPAAVQEAEDREYEAMFGALGWNR